MEPTDQPQQSAHGDENKLFNNVNAGGDINVGNRVGRDQIGRDQINFNVQDPQQAAEIFRNLRWDWPTPLHFANYRSFRSQGFEGRKWLFDAVRDWATADLSSTGTPQALLIGADYGVGKSAFLARLVDTEEAVVPVIAHHFCQYDVIDTLAPGRFVSSLAAQLAAGLPEYKAVIEAEPASSLRELLSNPENDPVGALVQSVLEPLAQIPELDGPRLLVIDALDEALEYRGSGGRDTTIVSLLAADRARRFPRWLRLVATSRRLPAVQRPLRQAFSLKDINAEQEDNLDDIRRYVVARCEQEPLATRLFHAGLTADEVAAALVEEGRSGGKFLYAALVLNDIANGELQLHQAGDLETLPVGMEEFYKQTFQRRFPNDATYNPVRDLLAVHAVQRDPLSRRELGSILARPESLIREQHLQLHDLLRMSKSDPAYEPGEVLAGFDHPSLSRWLSSSDEWGYVSAERFAIYRERAEAAFTRWALAEVENNRAHTSPYLVRNLNDHLPEERRSGVLSKLLGQFAWLEARLRLAGINALLADFTSIKQQDAASQFPIIEMAIRQASHILTHRAGWIGHQQLASQLLARISSNSGKSEVSLLLAEAASWLSCNGHAAPTTSSLVSPSALIRTVATKQIVQSITYLGNDSIACGCLDGNIQIWSLLDGELKSLLPQQGGMVGALATTRTGLLAAGSEDGIIYLWDPDNSSLESTLVGHSAAIMALVCLRDGQLLSCSKDATARVWDLATRKVSHTLAGHKHWVRSASIIADNLVATGSNDGVIRVWDLRTGECTSVILGIGKAVGALLAIGQNELICGCADGSIYKINLLSLECDLQSASHGSWVNALTALNETYYASGSGDKTIRLWDARTHKPVGMLRGHGGWVNDLITLPSGFLISGSGDATVRCWNPAMMSDLGKYAGHDGAVAALEVVDSKRIASGGADGLIRIWSSKTLVEEQSLAGSAGWALSMVPLSEDRLASGYENGSICIWSLDASKPHFFKKKHLGWVTSIVELSNGLLVSGSQDHTIRVWEHSSGECQATLRRHVDSVRALAVLSATRLASAIGRTIHIWDMMNNECIMTLDGHTDRIRTLVVIDSKTIASASNDSTIRIWDLEAGLCLSVLSDHDNWVRAIDVTQNGSIVSGSHDCTVRIWECSGSTWSQRVIFVTDTPITCLRFHSGLNCVFAGDKSGRLHSLQFPGS